MRTTDWVVGGNSRRVTVRLGRQDQANMESVSRAIGAGPADRRLRHRAWSQSDVIRAALGIAAGALAAEGRG